MVPELEITMLLLGTFGLFVVLYNRRELQRFPSFSLVLSSYLAAYVGWVATVLDEFASLAMLNLIEHACYTVGLALLGLWGWRVFWRKGTGPT